MEFYRHRLVIRVIALLAVATVAGCGGEDDCGYSGHADVGRSAPVFDETFTATEEKAILMSGKATLTEAVEIERLFDQTTHFISYQQDGQALWNTVAYFGGRYRVIMQVKVGIDKKNLKVLVKGEPCFQIDSIDAVEVDSSGEAVFASMNTDEEFLNGRESTFQLREWRKVYEAKGDFRRLGYSLNGEPVKGFQEFVKASRKDRVSVSLLKRKDAVRGDTGSKNVARR